MWYRLTCAVIYDAVYSVVVIEWVVIGLTGGNRGSFSVISVPTTLPPSRHPLGVLDIPSGTFACSPFACLAWLAGNLLPEEFPSELLVILPCVQIGHMLLFPRQSHRGAVCIGRQRHGRPWAGLTGSAGGACRSDCVAASKLPLVLSR